MTLAGKKWGHLTLVFETVSAFSARSCECFSQVPCSFHRNLYLVSNLEQIVRSHKNIKHLFTVINININTILFYFNTTVSDWSVSLQQRVTNASIFSHYILPDPAHLAAHSESESDDVLFIFRGYFSSFVFFLNLTSSITLPENVQNKNNNNQFVINVWSLQPGDFIYKL